MPFTNSDTSTPTSPSPLILSKRGQSQEAQHEFRIYAQCSRASCQTSEVRKFVKSAVCHVPNRLGPETASSIAPSTRHLRHADARKAVEQTTLTPVPERQPARRSTLSSAHSGTPADVASSGPKNVQCGLYAMEMLCGSYGVSRFINLLIVSVC